MLPSSSLRSVLSPLLCHVSPTFSLSAYPSALSPVPLPPLLSPPLSIFFFPAIRSLSLSLFLLPLASLATSVCPDKFPSRRQIILKSATSLRPSLPRSRVGIVNGLLRFAICSWARSSRSSYTNIGRGESALSPSTPAARRLAKGAFWAASTRERGPQPRAPSGQDPRSDATQPSPAAKTQPKKCRKKREQERERKREREREGETKRQRDKEKREGNKKRNEKREERREERKRERREREKKRKKKKKVKERKRERKQKKKRKRKKKEREREREREREKGGA